MKIKYYSKDDILVVKLRNDPYDYAEMEGNFVIHFTKDRRPVRIEILNASNFLKKQGNALPKEVKRQFFQFA